MNKKISIIVPCYNQEKYISECLESLINQSYKNIEIVCVDDFSTDNTRKIIKEFAKKDKRIKLIAFDVNLGTCVARSRAVNAATGDYIMFVDSDDSLIQQACEVALKNICNYDVDILQFGTNIVDCGASQTSIAWFTKFATPYLDKLTGNDVYFACFLEKKYGFNLWNKIYRASVVKQAFCYIKEGYYPKAQDMYAYNCIAYFATSYIGIEDKLYNYNYGRGITANKNIKIDKFEKISTQFHIIELLYKFLDDIGVCENVKYTAVLENYALSFANEVVNNYNKVEDLENLKKKAITAIVSNLKNKFSESEYAHKEVYLSYLKAYAIELNTVFMVFENDIEFKNILFKSNNLFTFSDKVELFKIIASSVDKNFLTSKYLNFITDFYKDSEYLLSVKKKIIPIVFATNDNYAAYLSVALQSLKYTCNKDYFYDVYIFNTNLSQRNCTILTGLSDNNVHIRTLNISNVVDSNVLYERDYFSIEMYYRLLIPEILLQYDKVLYLDCDIVINKSVSDLYNIDLRENILAVVNDEVVSFGQREYVTKILGIELNKYFNSGIILINCDRFIEQKIKKNCFDILSKYKKLSCPDQDALNISCKNKVLYLDKNWNFQNGRASYTLEDKYGEEHYIVHYTSAKKPWNTQDLDLSENFWKYARKSPYYESILYNYVNSGNKVVKNEITTRSVSGVYSERNIINTFEKIHYPLINKSGSIVHKKSFFSWPIRVIKRFSANRKEKGFRYACGQFKENVKYCINRLLGRVDKYNNQIVKYKDTSKNKSSKIAKAINKNIKLNGKNDKIIVSLTSYPARIQTIDQVISSIKNQTYKPEKIILWLADSQFPNREKDLPKKLCDLRDKQFCIKWCDDIRSYKKLIPTLKLYPDNIIVTADDDNIYKKDWLKRLYSCHLTYPNCIIAHRVTKFIINSNCEFKTVPGGKKYYKEPSYLNKLVGAGGVLYPVGSLYKDILDVDLFKKLASTNDDQWFWFMGILNNYKVKVCDYPIIDLDYVKDSQETALSNINDQGEQLFWKDLNNLLNYYPIVKEKLMHEYFKLAKNELTEDNFSDQYWFLKKNPKFIEYNYYKTLPIEDYPKELENWYNKRTNSSMDINNPKTFNEKIQWLKINDATLLKSHLTDKWLAKEYIRSVLGEKYLIKTLGVYEKFDDIDFEKLPDQFVIKSTHGSGQLQIVKDKKSLDIAQLKEKVESWLSKSYAYSCGMEMHYLNIIPRIIIEEYMSSINDDLYDYKVMCVGGKPIFIWVDTDRFKDHRRNFYDLNWKLLPVKYNCKNTDIPVPKPKRLKEMISLSSILARDFALVRCDFYVLKDGSLKFGELTFTSASGIDRWDPIEYDKIYGDFVQLPEKTKFIKYSNKEIEKSEKKFLKKYKKSR